MPQLKPYTAKEVKLLLSLFSHSVVSDSLPPDGLQQARLLSPLSSTVSQSLLKFMAIELVMLSNHLVLGCPHLVLPSVFPRIKAFPISLHQVAKVLELQQQSFQ